MKKKVSQNLGQVHAYSVYQANIAYEIADVVKVFKDNINKRKDLSAEFKQKALELGVGRNYEIVYYPAHIYQTDTTKSWNTTNSSTSHYDGYDVKTTTTTRHTKGGYQKVSEAKFKSDCSKLDIEKFDLNKTSSVNNFQSLSVPVYADKLFFSYDENNKNAIEAGRKASNAKKGDSTYTKWRLHIVLIPIFRFEFELCGKKCYFEMNLHNGTFITHYKQKGGCAFAKTVMQLGNILLGAATFVLPLLALITGFKAGCNDAGFLKQAIAILVLGICVIVGLIGGFFVTLGRDSDDYEKIFYEPVYLVNVYIANIIIFVVVVILSNIFKGMAFL